MSALLLSSLRRAGTLAALAVIAIGILCASARRASAEGEAYRRIFVPADRPEAWPTAGEQYLPVGRQEFERLTRSADQRRQLAELGGVQLTAARYMARLDEQSTLHGEASLAATLVDESPRVLPLSPLSLAISGARWKSAHVEPEEASALIGVWQRPTASAEYGVLVPKSGELLLGWSAPAQSTTPGVTEYRLQLPPALQREFVVDLPEDCAPSMSAARLASSDSIGGASPPEKRWRFQLDASPEHRLQIQRRTTAAPRQSTLPQVAVAEAYGFTPQGLTYEAELRVVPRAAAVSDLLLAIPESMQIAEVLIDRAPVAFDQDEQDPDTLVVPLPKSSAPLTLTIRGVAVVVLDKPWTLPSVTAVNAFWTEGTSTLWIDPTLELQAITPRSAGLLNSVGVGSVDGGEAHRLQSWSNEASIEVTVTTRPAQWHVESGVVAEFADRELAGRCRARLWTTGGAALQVTASLKPDWNLESVEATPADAMEEWHVAGEGRQRRLYVQLRRSPTELAPVHLSITARKPLRAWAPVATLRELDWIRFSGVDANGAHLLVSDRRGDELLAEQSALNGVESLASLPSSQRNLFDEPIAGMLLAADRIEPDATIRVVSTPPRFTGEARLELVRNDLGFAHRGEITCRPVAGAVNELIVHASRPLPADAQWSLAGSEVAPLVELTTPIPLPPAERRASAPASEIQQYRVRLPQPRAKEFQLTVAWRGDGAAADSVNSLTLPGAESWQSWAVLRGDPAAVKLDPRDCQPAAAVPAGHDDAEGATVLGSYRLGDDPSIPLALTPLLTVIPAPSGGGDVTCWLCDITTMQFADGNQTHRLAYQLEAHDAEAVELTIPEGFNFVSARVDGAAVSVGPQASSPQRIAIPLPGAVRDVTVAVDLHGQRRKLDAVERIAPPLPKTSFPVLRGQWTVATPAPFAVETETERHANSGWRQRLFGPLVGQPSDPTDRSFGLRSVIGADALGAADVQGASLSAATSDPFAIPHGWSSATQEFVTAPAPMELRRIDDARARWHVTWLCAAVMAVWQWAKRPRGVAAVALVAAILCLVLPANLVVAPQAVFLGAIAGAIVRELLLRTSRPQLSPPAAPSRSRASTIITALLAGVMFSASHPKAYAAEPKTPPRGVLYPIDEQGEPAGDDVYVPASLLAELMPSSQKSRFDGAEATLLAATCQLELAPDAASGELQLAGGSLRLKLRTFQRQAMMALPLDRRQIDDLSAATTLDGLPLTLTWNDSGEACSLAVAEPGDHDLLIALLPRTAAGANLNMLKLRVPPLPGAEVEISHPPGLQGLTVNGDRLAPRGEHPTQTVSSVPGVSELEVTWPKRLRTAASAVSIDQLTWLEVDPVVARVDVQLRLSGDAAALGSLEIAASPQLKLLPLPEESLVEIAQSFPGAPAVTEVRFRAPPRLPMTIPLQFQVQRSVSLGHIDFPAVRVLGLETASHHFAAFVDPRLRIREVTPSGMTPALASEMERPWMALPATPTLRYAVSSVEPNWSMYVEPLPPRFTPRERLDVLCTAEDAKVQYAAAITQIESEVLVYRLAVSPDLTVDTVNVTLDELNASPAVRWSRPRPDLLCVFLSRPLNQPHTLNVSGRVAYAADRRLPIPRIGLESTRTAAVDVGVSRTGEVLVAWSGEGETPPPAATPRDTSKATGIAVGEYAVARNAEVMPELVVEKNDAQLAVDGLLTLNLATPAEPAATLVLRGQVTRGAVDRVRLVADADWRGPFVAEPQAEVVVEPAPGDAAQNILDIRLAKPVAVDEALTLKLTGALDLATDQRIRFPQVRTLDEAEQRLFLMLPKTPGNQTAEWTLRGVQREPLPPALAEAAGLDADAAVQRVERAPFVAEQRVFPEALRNAAVRLTQTRLAVDRSGDWSALTQMIVQSGGATDVVFQMPPGAELLHAAIDGRTVVRPVVDRDRWQAPAGPRYLPRVFTIGYRVRHDDWNGRYEFQTPQVQVDGRPLVSDRSMWQVDGEPAANLIATGGAVSLSSEDYATAARREQLAAVVDAGPLAFQLPSWELPQWFQPWIDRLDFSSGKPTDANEELQEAAWAKMLQRLAASAGENRVAGDSPSASSVHDRFAESPTAAYYQGTPTGELSLTRAAAGWGLGRWVLALALAGVWAAAWRHPQQRDHYLSVASRYPAIWGVIAGLAWWLLLTPAVLGLAIAAFSLAALVKNRPFSVRRLLRNAVRPSGS